MSLIKTGRVQWTGSTRRVGAPAISRRRDDAPDGGVAARPSVDGQGEVSRLRAELDALRQSQREAIERARAQARSDCEQACALARAQGLEEGRRQIAADHAAQAAVLRDGMVRAQQAAQGVQASIEQLAVGVARLALRKLLGDADWRAPAQALAAARVCEALQPQGRSRIRLGPIEPGELHAMRQALRDAGDDLDLISDASLGPSTCLVEVDGCVVDATLREQLARLDAMLAAEVGHD